MTLPAAGWFPDPQDASRLRWWDGHAWGDATRVLPTQPEPVAPVVVASAGPSFSVHTGSFGVRAWASGVQDRRFCVFTIVAVFFALLSVRVNPIGASSVLALVSGVVGIVRTGATGPWRVLARSIAASALVVAVATAAVAASTQLHLF